MGIKILLISQEKVLEAVNGATRILYYFSNKLVEKGYEVVVAYPNEKNPEGDKFLDEKVKFYNLNYIDMSGFKSRYKRITLFERLLMIRCQKELKMLNIPQITDRIEAVIQREQPDIIIPFFAHVTSQLVFGRDYNIPIIQMYHTHPKVYHAVSPILNPTSKPMAILFNYTVKKVSYLQLFFESYVEFMSQYYKGPKRVIHNPVKSPNQMANLEEKKRKIIYLSRIDKNKGQDILINAFSLIAKNYPEWEVLLYGDFEPKAYRGVINGLITHNNLERQVKIMGVTNDTVGAFLEADLGAYTSAFEGFPLGLSEALAAGLPCIGLKTATGVNELIEDRKNGLLAENNVMDVARKLTELMNNTPLRVKYGQYARESMKQYSEDLFWEKWEALFEEALKNKK